VYALSAEAFTDPCTRISQSPEIRVQISTSKVARDAVTFLKISDISQLGNTIRIYSKRERGASS
jgi:hypothetical protein